MQAVLANNPALLLVRGGLPCASCTAAACLTATMPMNCCRFAVPAHIPQAAPELLAARMSQLLAGLATLVEAARARAFIQASPTLRLQLQDVDGTVRRVQAMRDAYVEVLGSPPKPALLAASQSSFSRATQQVFRSKLEFFVQGCVLVWVKGLM
jgi:hypothetical protein